MLDVEELADLIDEVEDLLVKRNARNHDVLAVLSYFYHRIEKTDLKDAKLSPEERRRETAIVFAKYVENARRHFP